MCGRYAVHGPKSRARDAPVGEDDFEFRGQHISIPPNLDASPTQRLPIYRLTTDGAPDLALARWGLVPAWAKDRPTQRLSTFNARSETASSKPMFRSAWRARRCLVPMNGYYEWRDEGGPRKQRYYVTGESTLLSAAGLWERWTDRDSGESMDSFTVVTCPAAAPIAWLHDRMPVILDDASADAWLATATPGEVLQGLCAPFGGALNVRGVDGPVSPPPAAD